mgnify:CR=1 FL=1
MEHYIMILVYIMKLGCYFLVEVGQNGQVTIYQQNCIICMMFWFIFLNPTCNHFCVHIYEISNIPKSFLWDLIQTEMFQISGIKKVY